MAADFAARGWHLRRALTGNGSEFRSSEFGDTIRELGATQTLIRPGRLASNGSVGRVQRKILEKYWRPSFARSLVPRMGGLGRDLESYLAYYIPTRTLSSRSTVRSICCTAWPRASRRLRRALPAHPR